ncbi:MAG: hypothetical protein HFI86_07420 [Bacilli bacterium]|nr:hypothetical protein [Bacilli bacterium]
MCKLSTVKRDYKGEQFNFLNIKIKNLTRDDTFLLNLIADLLQALYDMFRNILQLGKD